VAKEAGTVAQTKEDKNEALPNHRQGFLIKCRVIV